MHVFSVQFLNPIKGEWIEIINLHPLYQVNLFDNWERDCEAINSLFFLGGYKGKNAIEKAFSDFQTNNWENNENKTGVIVHHVVEQVDQGDVIMMREIEF